MIEAVVPSKLPTRMRTGSAGSVFAIETYLMLRCVFAGGEGTMVVVVAAAMFVFRSFGVIVVGVAPPASTHEHVTLTGCAPPVTSWSTEVGVESRITGALGAGGRAGAAPRVSSESYTDEPGFSS
jgi:hypothetical protein